MIEIERRFLVDESKIDALRPAARRWLDLHQFYLTADPMRAVRVRRAIDITPDDVLLSHRLSRLPSEFVLCVKGPKKNGAGTEVEAPIDAEKFSLLEELKLGRSINKERLEIPLPGSLTVELDIFAMGHVIAEVEFDSAQAANEFRQPEWFGREITGDHRYSNQSLAFS